MLRGMLCTSPDAKSIQSTDDFDLVGDLTEDDV